MGKIKSSVGNGGDNDPQDVEVVRTLLNKHAETAGFAKLGPKDDVEGAIRLFQSHVLGMKRPDGRVEPGKTTMSGLHANSLDTISKRTEIRGSVGKGGRNDGADVLAMKVLLNKKATFGQYPKMKLTPDAGTEFLNAVKKFQQNVLGFENPDGRIEPGKNTLAALNEAVADLSSAPESAGKVKVNFDGMMVRTYEVKGASLRKVMDFIHKKGPKDPNDGKRYAGATDCFVRFSDQCVVTSRDRVHGSRFQSTVGVGQAEINYSCVIRIPKFKGAKKLSKAAQAEWRQFIKEVESHEREHVKDFGKEVKKMAKELSAMTAEGGGSTVPGARKSGKTTLMSTIHKKFANDNLDKRLNASAKALDGNHHGPSLDTSVK